MNYTEIKRRLNLIKDMNVKHLCELDTILCMYLGSVKRTSDIRCSTYITNIVVGEEY